MPKTQVSLTQGSVAKGMLTFAVPIFLSNLFQQLYNAVDSLIVGNFLGEHALAAVGSSGSLIFLLTGFVNGVSLGAGVLVARYFGAKDDEALRKAVHTTVALGLAAGAALTVIGVALSPQILRWMGTPDDVIGNSIVYFRVYFMGCIAVVLYNVGASILQSVGDSRSPMLYLIAASVLNVVLDLLFVAGFHMGVGSAAFATILSQILSAALAFRKLGKATGAYAVRWRQVRFDAPTLRAVVAQGLPSGVQNSVISLANVIVQANINAFGAQAMAGCAAYSKVEGFAFLPVTCFSMALATFVSQNIGARQPGRVRRGMKFGILSSAALAEVIGVAIFALSPFLIAAFNSEPEVVAYGVRQGGAVLLPAGVQPLLRGHPARAGAAGRADGRDAGRVVRAAHQLHHGGRAAGAGHRRDFLGLSADLDDQRPGVRLLPAPHDAARPRRRRTAAPGGCAELTAPL